MAESERLLKERAKSTRAALGDGPTRILLVEHEPQTARLLQHHFEKEGWQVVWVADGEQAEQILEREYFDLALVDLNAPYRSGLDLLQLVRKRSFNHSMKSVLITSLHQEQFSARAFGLGAVDILSKPIDPVLVVNRLKLILFPD